MTVTKEELLRRQDAAIAEIERLMPIVAEVDAWNMDRMVHARKAHTVEEYRRTAGKFIHYLAGVFILTDEHFSLSPVVEMEKLLRRGLYKVENHELTLMGIKMFLDQVRKDGFGD